MENIENVQNAEQTETTVEQTETATEVKTEKKKSLWKRFCEWEYSYMIVCFFLPFLILLGAYAGLGTHPFGNNSVLTLDLQGQYIYYFEQIRRLLKTVNHGFDMSACTEFTFEAGRPDTITTDKLAACLEGGVDRISINPQTMSDGVLAAVGRAHTASDVIKVFDDARRLGFKNINMDLIAGLPTDTFEGFKYSLSELIKLSPESITVHTLAYKRSSDLDYRDGLFSATRNVSLMVDHATDTLYANGYIPYYMYRQAKSVGNLENVGWCKPGFESRYNIFMMEECHTILACGAGAVTKLKEPGGMQISRIFNFKYPFEYNSNFAEQINRKKAISEFYGHTGISENC